VAELDAGGTRLTLSDLKADSPCRTVPSSLDNRSDTGEDALGSPVDIFLRLQPRVLDLQVISRTCVAAVNVGWGYGWTPGAGVEPTRPTNVPSTSTDRPPASSLARCARTRMRTRLPGRQLTSPRMTIDPRDPSLSADVSRCVGADPTNIVAFRPVSCGNATVCPRRAMASRISRNHHGGVSSELCWMRSVRTRAPSSHFPHHTYVLPRTRSGTPAVDPKRSPVGESGAAPGTEDAARVSHVRRTTITTIRRAIES
jgi:hypothetical protein